MSEPYRFTEADELASLLASATDLLNSWAREFGVSEAYDERDIKGVINRLWNESAKTHWGRND